ncbi:MAG TPA: O-methyltransferase [Bacillota bacterium]
MGRQVEQVLDGLEQLQADIDRRRRQGEDLLPLLCLSRDAACLLHILVASIRARRVLEIGTSSGWSGTWIATALPEDGQLVTIEAEPRKVELARRTFADAGIAGRVRIVEGRALEVLPSIPGPFDLVFIDAVKSEYLAYFEAAAPLVLPGGLIVADNVISHAGEVQPYLEHVKAAPGYVSVTVPIGSGLEVTLKR